LFQRPFGRIEITGEDYLIHLVTYIHQNPQKHGLVPDFRSWSYSSYHAILVTDSTRLQRDVVLSWFGGCDNIHLSHKHMIVEHPLVPEDFD
jgi:putative transposase